jgi:hypothetical protein
MNPTHFDHLTRSLATIHPRRGILAAMIGVALAGSPVASRGQGRGTHCRRDQQCASRSCCAGACCTAGQVCAEGRCVACVGEVVLCSDAPCCGGLVCFEGRCQPCVQLRGACVFSTQCCPGLACDNPTGAGGTCRRV